MCIFEHDDLVTSLQESSNEISTPTTKSLSAEVVESFEGFENIVGDGIGEEAQPGVVD